MSILSIGERIYKIRKTLNLTQEEFAERLGINKGTISNLEKDRQNPSEQLIRLICLEYIVSENFLKTGEGEMFISPEEAINEQIERFGDEVFIKALRIIMRERGYDMSEESLFPIHSNDDAELKNMINTISNLWITSDERFKTWLSVQVELLGHTASHKI